MDSDQTGARVMTDFRWYQCFSRNSKGITLVMTLPLSFAGVLMGRCSERVEK